MARFLPALVLVIHGALPVAAQVEWTPYEDNPVIGTGFDPESQAIYRPTVVKWNGLYHMWYGKFWLQTRWMAYTTSEDGITWNDTPPLFDNAVLGPSETGGTFDESEATYGSVIVDGDTLKMWYAGRGSKASGIGLAWSLDGSAWNKVAGPGAGQSVLDPVSEGSGAQTITLPTVVKHMGVYHMWYSRITPTTSALGFESRLGYALSNDGKSWQVVSGSGQDGAVLDLGSAMEFDAVAILYPAVLHNGDEFRLWYQGVGFVGSSLVPRVGCARSQDGITWEKVADSRSQAGECFRAFAQPAVLYEDGLYRMWYALSAADPNDDVVMYATSGQAGTATEGNELPSSVETTGVYPNPTASTAKIFFSVGREGLFVLEVHDMLGRLVSRIDLGLQTVGEQTVTWNGSGIGTSAVPAGSYLLSITNATTGERATAGIIQVVR